MSGGSWACIGVLIAFGGFWAIGRLVPDREPWEYPLLGWSVSYLISVLAVLCGAANLKVGLVVCLALIVFSITRRRTTVQLGGAWIYLIFGAAILVLALFIPPLFIDSYMHWLLNAAYLFQLDSYPQAPLENFPSRHPTYPGAFPLAIYIASVVTGSFRGDGGKRHECDVDPNRDGVHRSFPSRKLCFAADWQQSRVDFAVRHSRPRVLHRATAQPGDSARVLLVRDRGSGSGRRGSRSRRPVVQIHDARGVRFSARRLAQRLAQPLRVARGISPALAISAQQLDRRAEDQRMGGRFRPLCGRGARCGHSPRPCPPVDLWRNSGLVRRVAVLQYLECLPCVSAANRLMRSPCCRLGNGGSIFSGAF